MARVFLARVGAAVAAMLALASVAQQPPPQAPPVRLRLANSLCASMAQQTVAWQLVPPLASSARPEASLNATLAQRMERERDVFFARLDAMKPFNGLYAVGDANHTLLGPNEGGRYSVGLEWELFDRGREDARRQLDRARIENKAQYLQMLRDTQDRELQEHLLAIQQMRNKLLATLYQREAAAIQPVLQRRRQELAAGRVTKTDVAEIEYRAEVAALRAQHFSGLPDVLVYPQAHELINRIEAVELRPAPDLVDRAVERSPEAQLQALLVERIEYLPRARDRLALSLFAERAKDFDRGPYNVAGVRMRIPLDRDRGRDEVVEAARELYTGQRESVRAAMEQKIALLSERLRLRQGDMRVLQAQSRLLRQKVEMACYRLDHQVASLPGDPERDVEELSLQLQELQREILVSRLDVLEVLTQLSALVKPREPQELYSLSRH
ncbi:TolC family protein [Ramlibacter sp. AN1133]|uniref:TolC family protein n=1 Tax=Ramlibacter sp. AN1133 TaxID=3133429 RepID=UPI0030C64181